MICYDVIIAGNIMISTQYLEEAHDYMTNKVKIGLKPYIVQRITS
jgi:hypothetical protein